jgi:hypothetical protein
MVIHTRLLRPRFLLWLAVPLLLLWSLRGISVPEVWGVLASIGPGQIGLLALVNGLVVLAPG